MDEKNTLISPEPQAGKHSSSPSGMQSLLHMLGVLFRCLRILILLIFAYLLASGVFRVDEQNEAMLFRFGKLQYRSAGAGGTSPVLTSGRWYWAWPSPIDWVKTIPAQKSITISTNTMFQPWTNPNVQGEQPENKSLRPGTDGYLLTGDMNIVHARWEVNYRVTNSAKYYLDFLDDSDEKEQSRQHGVEAIIRNLLADAALNEVSEWKVEDLLKTSRILPNGKAENITEKVQHRLAKSVEEAGLGVEIQAVNLVDIRPPAAVQAAFRNVNDASENGRAEILKAKSYAEGVKINALGEARKMLDEAHAYCTRINESLKADSRYFLTVLAQYEKNPESMLTTLYMDAIREMLKNVPNKFVLHTAGPRQNQELRLKIGLAPTPKKAPETPQE